MTSQTIYFQLTVAAPTHIGCGEVYEPTGFVIDTDYSELISFEPARFLAQLSSDERDEFASICKAGTVESIQDLYKFMRRMKDTARGERIAVCTGFADHYEQTLNKPKALFKKELNQFSIARTAFNPLDGSVYIPGSSIKGSIRTAVLNNRNQGRKSPRFTGNKAGLELQEHLLKYQFRDIASDPFRLIKVSDFVPAGTTQRSINYALNIKKAVTAKNSAVIPQLQEVLIPGSRFWGSVTVLPAPSSIHNPVTLAEIDTALRYFYEAEKKREDSELNAINISPVALAETDGTALRIGRHSGAEALTVNGHRHIKISAPGKELKFSSTGATTFWLAADTRKSPTPGQLTPMGWVQLRILTNDECTELMAARERDHEQKKIKYRQQIEQAAAHRRETRKTHEENERRRQEKEEEIKREKARQKALQEQWQAMSTLDQDIAVIMATEVARQEAADRDPLRDIWPTLEQADEDTARRLAQAFSEVWRHTPSKWRKKQCAPGQWRKVERVVEILAMHHEDIVRISEPEQARIAQIESLEDWGQWQSAGITIAALTLPAARIVEKKFRKWGCDMKKAKPAKKKAFKELRKHLSTLQRS
ncbi:MAG: type III-A CRISPR-associated RAMP protein Csm5 [Desulfofustis sp. PB-SRB1]|jgi:CRISPR-associated protein Csm5|nr:type III-A CRISPR-associated RAMP protein Csm5 [Desulfofustis sp. PB-SRB1]HBH29884.1 type III-A CRISPR-associated RAMP protein Csm5 [Desulfofustis sp.]